ncbi:unnamed protein product [Brugia timori]|uniref:Ovule protein n=1 Tax=Brugia timori TaxID=42155 RepID=A0A0R3QFP5_9BILA|nr:unnamed protein product [Brugia timori]
MFCFPQLIQCFHPYFPPNLKAITSDLSRIKLVIWLISCWVIFRSSSFHSIVLSEESESLGLLNINEQSLPCEAPC